MSVDTEQEDSFLSGMLITLATFPPVFLQIACNPSNVMVAFTASLIQTHRVALWQELLVCDAVTTFEVLLIN